MKLVFISDTHCAQPKIPDGDVLIHCGDHTYQGKSQESFEALTWLDQQPHQYKIYIAGNHEVGWERGDIAPQNLTPNCHYLKDSSIIIDGVKFWGSPVQPDFCNWAFQKPRGQALKAHWSQIPEDTDVLITHGPPAGIGDSYTNFHIGDEDLLNRVLEVKPKIHCFGHNHEGYGIYEHEGIKFINAAILDDHYEVAHAPIEICLNLN